MTSNIGSQIIQENFEKITEKNRAETVGRTKDAVEELLKQSIRPEFFNRIDEVIMFQPLMKKEIEGIVRIQLQQLKNMLTKNNIDITFTDYTISFLSENGFDPQFGARPLKRFIQKEIVNPLSKKILAGEVNKNNPVLVDVFDGVVAFRNAEVHVQ